MQRSARRLWLFRGGAILVGLAPLLLLELLLQVTGVAAPPSAGGRSHVAFASTRPLFRLSAGGRSYEIGPERLPFFKRDTFAAAKGPSEYRVFCFGGSTVQGNPYSIETSFTTWLELSLRAADPRREWQVVNCGGISYASYRLAPIWQECLAYEPDLFVLCVGHNEFLEQREYASSARRMSPALRSLSSVGSRSHVVELARRGWQRLATSKASRPTRLASEVDALLDYEGGLAEYRRDDAWRAEVERHFEGTIRAMLAEAQRRGIPVLVIDPVANLRHQPPFKSEPGEDLDARERATFQQKLAAATNPDAEDAALEAVEAAVAIDPRHANAQYLLGQAYLREGLDDEAAQALQRACDEDLCPLRITSTLRQALKSAARDANVPLLPIRDAFAERSPHRLPGDEWLLDHVHPTISGHQLIAELLLEAMQSEGWVSVQPGWQERRRVEYDDHLATLDAPYYARGREHLEGLRRWTTGRVKKLRPTPPDASSPASR